ARDDGEPLRTAETVPGVSPTCSATVFNVTAARFFPSFFKRSFIIPHIVVTETRSRRHSPNGGTWIKATRILPQGGTNKHGQALNQIVFKSRRKSIFYLDNDLAVLVNVATPFQQSAWFRTRLNLSLQLP